MTPVILLASLELIFVDFTRNVLGNEAYVALGTDNLTITSFDDDEGSLNSSLIAVLFILYRNLDFLLEAE